jgi:hypothetical protein
MKRGRRMHVFVEKRSRSTTPLKICSLRELGKTGDITGYGIVADCVLSAPARGLAQVVSINLGKPLRRQLELVLMGKLYRPALARTAPFPSYWSFDPARAEYCRST